MTPSRVVVAGGSLGGLATVESLRKNGHRGSITVLAGEESLPYDRPPLSKQVLTGEWEPDRIRLRDAEDIRSLDVDWRLGVRATELDLGGRQVGASDGTAVGFDHLVVATGASCRELPGAGHLAGVHVLRTLEDALALRSELRAGARAVVVGAGFIGAEVAAAAITAGMTVTVVERLPRPLDDRLGPVVGAFCEDLQLRNGVDLRCGTGVVTIEGDAGRVTRVVLDGGATVAADLVVVGIGAVPNTAWLGDQLPIGDGLRCDEYCSAAPGVWAVGDVARWTNPLFAREMRIEHLTNAREQAGVVAHNLLAVTADRKSYAPVPYFWSDQFGTKLQFFGHADPDTDWVHVVAAGSGSAGSSPFLALYERDGRLVGAFGASAARRLVRYRGLIATAAPIGDALQLAAV